MADNVNATRSGSNATTARGAAKASQQRSALDPTVPILVQPYKRLVAEGYITELVCSFTPTGVSVKAKADERMVAVVGSGLNTTEYYPVGRLAAVAEKGALAPAPTRGRKKKSGPAVQLPEKSLCAQDFINPTREGLQARINSIAASAGGGPLVGRVRSAGKFTGTETVSYQTWWETASADSRAASLSQKRHYDALTAQQKALMQGLQCPFRGTAEFAVSAQAEDDE
jgi:hypothetical protein